MTRFVVVVAVALAACAGDTSGPVIEALAPASAARGQNVTITGDRFCGDAPEAADATGACVDTPERFVTFGEDADVARGTTRSWSQTEIVVEVPQTARRGPTLVVVTVNGVSSNAADFEVL